MKKIKGWIRKGVILSVIGTAAFCLAACGRNHSEKENASESAAQSEETAEGEITGTVTDVAVSAEEESGSRQTAEEKAGEPITLIGDSVMLGAAPALQEVFSRCYVDAAESRQVVQAGDIADSLEEAGNLAPTVVIALGTNGTFSQATGQALIDRLGSDREIYWVTAYGRTLEWQDDSNAAIEQIAAENENVQIIDWAAAAEGHSEWFYNDGIHLNVSGQEAYADVILKGVTGEAE